MKRVLKSVLLLIALITLPMGVQALGNTGNPEHHITTCGNISNCRLTITKQGSLYAYGHKIEVKEAPGGICISTNNGTADTSFKTEAECDAEGSPFEWFSYSLVYIDDSAAPVDLSASTYGSLEEGTWAPGEFTYNQVFDPTLTGDLKTDATNGFNLYDSMIVGGSKNESYTGNTEVILTGGTVYGLVGGNSAYATGTDEYNANLTGSTSVTVEGGYVVDSIILGSQVTYSSYTDDVYATANISGGVEFNLLEGTNMLAGYLYFGSYLKNDHGTSTIGGTATINAFRSIAFTDDYMVGTADVLNVFNGSDALIDDWLITKTINVEGGSSLSVNVPIPTTIEFNELVINAEMGSTISNNCIDPEASIPIMMNEEEIEIAAGEHMIPLLDDEDDPSVALFALFTENPNDIELTVNTLTEGATYNRLHSLMDANEEMIVMYDLDLVGNPVNDNILVVFRLPLAYAGKIVKIYHLPEGETTADEYTATVDDEGIVMITVESLSPFMITEAVTSNPNTGDGVINSIVIGCISLISLLGVGLYTKKKRFN